MTGMVMSTGYVVFLGHTLADIILYCFCVCLCQLCPVDMGQPLFQPYPSELVFQNFTPAQTYKLCLLLLNNDKVCGWVTNRSIVTLTTWLLQSKTAVKWNSQNSPTFRQLYRVRVCHWVWVVCKESRMIGKIQGGLERFITLSCTRYHQKIIMNKS